MSKPIPQDKERFAKLAPDKRANIPGAHPLDFKPTRTLMSGPMIPIHTEDDRRGVERRAAELTAQRSFNPRAFLDMASRMDPPYGDRAAYWHAISTYIGKLEKLARVRGPHSPKLK